MTGSIFSWRFLIDDDVPADLNRLANKNCNVPPGKGARRRRGAKLETKQNMFFPFSPTNSVWTPELRRGTSKIGFLVQNYPYSEIVRTLGPDLGQNASSLIF